MTSTNKDFRRLLATANELETIQTNLISVIDFFSTPIVKLYSRLCNDCLKLLFECEFKLEYYRKAEELVWRRVYHDIYRFQRSKRRPIKRLDECLMESHFISGIAFYSSLIVKLRYRYGINDVKGIIKPLDSTLGDDDNIASKKRNEDCKATNGYSMFSKNNANIVDIETQTAAKEWACQAIYRCLVYMGDLARYLLETSQFNFRSLSFQFYRSASRYQPDYGLPFNQLATLTGGLNYNLGAICNYMRCCLRPKPFEGAEGNMRKLFDMNNKLFEDLKLEGNVCKLSEVSSSKDPHRAAEAMVREVIVTFIKLTSDLWMAATQESKNETIFEQTILFFEILREALELEPVNSTGNKCDFHPISGGNPHSSERLRYISPTIMYEFCSISIMLISKCQKQALVTAADDVQTTNCLRDLVHTLALNLLHYSTSKCQKMVMFKIQDFKTSYEGSSEGSIKITSSRFMEQSFKELGANSSTSSSKSNTTTDSSNKATSKRVLSRMIQRKAATNYFGSGFKPKQAGYQEDLDLGELEETALSTIDALEISSDMSDNADYPIDDLINLDSSGDEISGVDLASQSKQTRLPIGSSNRLIKPILRQTRSQNYELEKSTNMHEASNSLPVPDLLTGDVINDTKRADRSTRDSSYLEYVPDSCIKGRYSANARDKYSQQLEKELDIFEITMGFLYSQTYLATIKIFCDWLLSNSEIISLNLMSFRSFCLELCELVTLLKDLKKMAETKGGPALKLDQLETSSNMSLVNIYDDNQIYLHLYNGPAWIQKYPLSCDYPLAKLSSLKSVHALNIDFSYEEELSDAEAGFITIQCIEAFYYALSTFLDNKSFQ